MAGTDTGAYMQMYRYIGNTGYTDYPEILYGYLNQYFYRWGFSFAEFQTIILFVCMLIAGYGITKHSPNINMSLFCLFGMYFVCYAMNITRQVCACFILLSAYSFLIKRKNIIFFLLVLLAFGFHKAAIISLLLIFIRFIPIKAGTSLILLILSFGIGLIMNNEMITPFVGDYAQYLNSQGEREGVRILLAIFLAVFWMIGFVTMYLTSNDNLKSSIYMKFYFFSVLINNIMLRQELGIRIVLLFSIMQVVFYPLYANNAIISKKMAMIIVITYISIFLFTFLGTNSAQVVL